MYSEKEQKSRNTVIARLNEWYDYPFSTWERMSTKQLWAIFYKGEPQARIREREEKAALAERIPRVGDDDYKEEFRTINGVTYILADSGEYVEYFD